MAHPLLSLQEGQTDSLELCGQCDEGAGEEGPENQAVPLSQLGACRSFESAPGIVQTRSVCIPSIHSLRV